jgi:ABC-type phosphate transport system auxiliary subunit
VAVTLLLAVLGALAVAVGVGAYSWPAGVIVAGIEALAAAYIIRYLEARREVP